MLYIFTLWYLQTYFGTGRLLRYGLEVMAGYRYCCGYPHYSTGRLKDSEKLFTDLFFAIKKVNPKVVITGCAECYVALKIIKEKFNADFKPITTSEWILQNMDNFNLSKTKEKVTFHDACMLSRLENLSENPRKIIKEIAELVEMEENKENSLCCGGMRATHNQKGLLEFREKKLKDAKATGAEKMITECITCWEKYNPPSEEQDIKIEDIVGLVYNSYLKEK